MNFEIALSSWRPNADLANALERSLATPEHNYHYGDEQNRIAESLAINYDYIVVLALRGFPSKAISAGMGVSREAIDRRLRPLGFKNPPGKRGAPFKSSRLVASL
jgi:hypothetical protein